MTDLPLQFFDPHQDHTMVWNGLPHWAQAGTICFITWRTADSLTRETIEQLKQRRCDLLKQFQLDPDADWDAALAKLPAATRAKLHWLFFTAWDDELDRAAGDCVLRHPKLSAIVMESLQHFDGDRYWLTDAVVMPNHLHLLVAFRNEAALIDQCTSWKRYTATRINRCLKGNTVVNPKTGVRAEPAPTGEFWRVSQFDHLVRNEIDFERYRRYIADNLRKIEMQPDPCRYYSKRL